MTSNQWRTAIIAAAAVLFAVAFLVRRSEIRLVRQLRDRYRFHGLNALERWLLRRLVRHGAATLVDEGHYAFIPDGYASYRARRRKRGVVALLVLVAAAVAVAVKSER